MNDELVAIEVKFSAGGIKSSMPDLERGEIQQIIKVQIREEKSTDTIKVLLLKECHKLGEMLGKPTGKTKYDIPNLEF
jgi:hypothetical protein